MGSRFDTALVSAQTTVDQCVGAGVVNVRTGELLAAHPRGSRDVLIAAASAEELFLGDNSAVVEKLLGGEDQTSHYVQEIIIDAGDLVHIYLRCKHQQDTTLLTVCRASANLGMVLTRARSLLPIIEAACQSGKKEPELCLVVTKR